MRVFAKLAFIAIAQAVRWLPITEKGGHYQFSPCGIFGGQTVTAKSFFPCRYFSTIARRTTVIETFTTKSQ